MACTNCFQNCSDIPSDNCVKYTGPDVPLLGICTGDTLSMVEAQIFEHLIGVMDGSSINLTDVSLENCTWLQAQFIGKDKTIVNLFQLLIDNQCTLKAILDSFSTGVQVFDTKCLTGLPENPTSVDILQAVVTQSCSMKTTVDSFPSNYVKTSDLESLVLQIMQANPASINFPKNIPVPYIGNLSNFSNTGVGTGDYAGWFIMNGLNGTQDWRGRAVVGAVRGVPGASLDAAVDPAVKGSNINYGIGDKFGEAFHALSPEEGPAHNHPVTDPGHIHPMAKFWMRRINYGNENSTRVLQENQGQNSGLLTPVGDTSVSKATTGITVGVAGSGLAHENRQPSVAGVWIVRL